MKRLIGNILTPLLLAGIAVPALTQTPPAEAPGLPDGEGLTTYEAVCGACHGADIVIGSQGSKARWPQDREREGQAGFLFRVREWLERPESNDAVNDYVIPSGSVTEHAVH